MTTVEMAVPANAKTMIGTMFLKKCSLFML